MFQYIVVYRDPEGTWHRFGNPLVWDWQVQQGVTSCGMAHPGCSIGVVRAPLGCDPDEALQVAADATRYSGSNIGWERTPGTSALDKKREAMEMGEGGDHDEPYHFHLPTEAYTVARWLTLLARVQRGQEGGRFDGGSL